MYTDTSFGKTGKDIIVALAYKQDCDLRNFDIIGSIFVVKMKEIFMNPE